MTLGIKDQTHIYLRLLFVRLLRRLTPIAQQVERAGMECEMFDPAPPFTRVLDCRLSQNF